MKKGDQPMAIYMQTVKEISDDIYPWNCSFVFGVKSSFDEHKLFIEVGRFSCLKFEGKFSSNGRDIKFVD